MYGTAVRADQSTEGSPPHCRGWNLVPLDKQAQVAVYVDALTAELHPFEPELCAELACWDSASANDLARFERELSEGG